MRDYLPIEPSRADIDRHDGGLILEFGAAWCGICQAAQPNIQAALSEHPQLNHLKIAGGPGLPLGRSFGIKDPSRNNLADLRLVGGVRSRARPEKKTQE